MSMFSFFRQRYAPLPTDVPSFPIPLPFVTQSGVDLGNNPVQNDVLNEFKKIGRHDAFMDVSADLDRYINGENFATVTALMTPPQIEQHYNECWDRFQTTQLVPAINRMVPRDAAIGRLSPRQRACPSPADFHRQGINEPLSHLEFFATNLYTKPGSFYNAVNRSLLQMEQNEVRINAKAYDDDKKTFNVWFYLFLSGLQKLIVPVPALFSSAPGNAETVRLYRGMPLDSDLSNSLWEKPQVWAKKEDAFGNFVPNQNEEDHKVTYYTSLGFSSYTTSVVIACQFSQMTGYTRKLPNVIVYEPGYVAGDDPFLNPSIPERLANLARTQGAKILQQAINAFILAATNSVPVITAAAQRIGGGALRALPQVLAALQQAAQATGTAAQATYQATANKIVLQYLSDYPEMLAPFVAQLVGLPGAGAGLIVLTAGLLQTYLRRNGKISLPSLRFISDTAGEEEYLMFPNHEVMIFSREDGVLQSDILNERCILSPTRINWIGITDASDSGLREGIKPTKTRSGGTKRTRSRRARARRARARRTRVRRTRVSYMNKKK